MVKQKWPDEDFYYDEDIDDQIAKWFCWFVAIALIVSGLIAFVLVLLGLIR